MRRSDQKHTGHVTFSVKFEMYHGVGGSVAGKELQVKGSPLEFHLIFLEVALSVGLNSG